MDQFGHELKDDLSWAVRAEAPDLPPFEFDGPQMSNGEGGPYQLDAELIRRYGLQPR